MDLPPELRVIHEPVRLRIMGLLYRQTDLGYATLRDTLGLTAGNLASHAERLADAGLIAQRDALTRGGFEKRCQITPKGIQDFERYLGVLDEFLAQTRQLAAPSAASATPGHGANVTALTAPAAAAKASGGNSRVVLAAMGVGGLFMAAEVAQNLLSDASGSSYIGIGITGGLVAALAPLDRFVRRMAEVRLNR